MRTMKHWALAAMTATALALAGCGGGGSGSTATGPTTPVPAPPTELEVAQMAAADAAMAAMTAAGNAATSADDADAARANAATMQTGESSSGIAAMARAQAMAADDAYMAAKKASEAAAAADNVTDAVKAQVMAESAQEDAEMAESNAAKYAQMAMDAADGELMISGTMKSVGDTTVDATAGASTVTVGEGSSARTVRTGEIKSMAPMTTVAAVTGVDFVAGDGGADPPVADTAYVQAVAARTFGIGKVVDSSDDMARLMIVTKYAGSKMVNVYATASGSDLTGRLGSDGRIQTAGVDTADNANDDGFATLTAKGMYYLAGAVGDADGLVASDVVGATAKGAMVYSYVDDNATPDNADDDTTGYVVLETTAVTGTTTTVTYQQVDIMALASDATTQGTAEEVEVTAKIPEAMDYKHIHFGVWAALGDAKANGDQSPSGLGIGFVQSIGDGLSGSDMPNNGSGSYAGNWAAAVQAMDEDGDGAVSLTNGAASLMADFGKGKLTATLTGLATLSGDISGNMFSGDKASDITHANLDATADFEGSFSGGFFGAKAAEAGGIFDFASEDNEGGAFRGAFGADRTD